MHTGGMACGVIVTSCFLFYFIFYESKGKSHYNETTTPLFTMNFVFTEALAISKCPSGVISEVLPPGTLLILKEDQS